MSTKRTIYAAVKRALHATRFLSTLKHENIVRYDNFCYVTFVEGGRVRGFYALDRAGNMYFEAGAVIVATGGAGRVYRLPPTAFKSDGMALALERARRSEHEFVQFHPTGLVRTGILITEAARGEGVLLNNRAALYEGYLPQKMNWPRDMVSRAMISEMRQAGSECVWRYIN